MNRIVSVAVLVVLTLSITGCNWDPNYWTQHGCTVNATGNIISCSK
jgi:hypothetical protein